MHHATSVQSFAPVSRAVTVFPFLFPLALAWLSHCLGQVGYFVVDPDTTEDSLVLGFTVGLKESTVKKTMA